MKKLKILLSISALIFVSYFIYTQNALEITYLTVDTGYLENQIRVVHLTDLHNREFGTDNKKLIKVVKDTQPDLIFLTGDMINFNEENVEVMIELLKNLTEIASVYYSYGNHEMSYEERHETKLNAKIEETGAVCLDKAYVDVSVKGEKIRIGGSYGYILPEDNEAVSGDEAQFMHEFQETDRYKLLLCHIPVSWMAWGSLEYWDVNCVFSGHVHGGQMRLPIVGAIYAPDLGWFPGRLAGLYQTEDYKKTLVLSRGLGSMKETVPRINNRSEVVVVNLS